MTHKQSNTYPKTCFRALKFSKSAIFMKHKVASFTICNNVACWGDNEIQNIISLKKTLLITKAR